MGKICRRCSHQNGRLELVKEVEKDELNEGQFRPSLNRWVFSFAVEFLCISSP